MARLRPEAIDSDDIRSELLASHWPRGAHGEVSPLLVARAPAKYLLLFAQPVVDYEADRDSVTEQLDAWQVAR